VQRIQWNWAQPDRERGWINGGNIADLMTSSSGTAIDGTPTNVTTGPGGLVGNGIFLNLTNRLLPPGSPNPHNWLINEFSWFVQDDIKVTRHLTVNMGVRWEYDGWPSDAHGVFTNFAAQTAGLVNTGSFFLGNQIANCAAFPCATSGNPVGTLAGYIVQSNFNKAFYGNLTGANGSTGIFVNNNKTLLYGSPLDNFSPRIGVAWQPFSEKLVIRAGYGMFFDRVYGNLVGDNILGNEPPYATGIGTNPSETLQNPFVFQPFLGFIPRTLKVTGAVPGFGATAFSDINGGNATGLITSGDSPQMATPKVQQYNVDLQYEFAHGWVADIGYVGTHGVHLFDWNRAPNLAYLVAGAPNPPAASDVVNTLMQRPASSFPINDAGNTNPLTQVVANTGTNLLGRVSYLGVAPSGLQQVKTDGNHLYNSLQAQLKHQFSHGLTIQASYTWSKLITDINASAAGAGIATGGNVLSGSASVNDPLNTRQQYGLAAFNRPHRFVVNYAYEMPYKGEGWHNKVLGGWGVSGVTTIQTGLPFTITDGNIGTIYDFNPAATGGYARAELASANTGACSPTTGVCKAVGSLGTSGSMRCRLGIQVFGSTCEQPFINPNAFMPAPVFGGVPNPAWAAINGQTGCNTGTRATPLVPQFVLCGSGFGNSGTGIMSCCTQLNFDMAIIKNTVVGGLREDASLQFRAEFYNLFNHAQYNEPGNNRSGANFGQITSSSVPGRILQFGLKYIF
jgi:hypothetical protein